MLLSKWLVQSDLHRMSAVLRKASRQMQLIMSLVLWNHYHPAAWFRSPSSVMVKAEPYSDRSRPMLCNSSQMGPCQITKMWLWPAADYEPYRRRVSIDKVWWQTATTSQSCEDDAVKWLEYTATTAFAELNEIIIIMINITVKLQVLACWSMTLLWLSGPNLVWSHTEQLSP